MKFKVVNVTNYKKKKKKVVNVVGTFESMDKLNPEL